MNLAPSHGLPTSTCTDPGIPSNIFPETRGNASLISAAGSPWNRPGGFRGYAQRHDRRRVDPAGGTVVSRGEASRLARNGRPVDGRRPGALPGARASRLTL